jgi:hypothetical protein
MKIILLSLAIYFLSTSVIVVAARKASKKLLDFKKQIQDQIGEETCYAQWIGDHACDSGCNRAEFNFDGGDCSTRFQAEKVKFWDFDDPQSGFTLSPESKGDHHVEKYFEVGKSLPLPLSQTILLVSPSLSH